MRHVRRAQIVSIQAVDDLERLNYPDESATPEQYAIDRDELRRLAAAIATMPGKTREAFMLRRVEGLSQREIAVQMRISESTVEKHISRGVRLLIEWFGRGGKVRPQTSRDTDLEISPFEDRAYNQSKH